MAGRLLLAFILTCFTTKISCAQSTTRDTDGEIKGFKHPECPATDLREREPVSLPHPKDCTKFYICSNGLAYEKKCMHDLHFNQRLRVCDYKESAQCSRRIGVRATPSKCPKGNKELVVHLPHESSCEYFYTCDFGEAILMKCPKGLHFNANQYVCDYPDRAGCSVEFKVTTINDDTLKETDSVTILNKTESRTSDNEPSPKVTETIATTRAPIPKVTETIATTRAPIPKVTETSKPEVTETSEPEVTESSTSKVTETSKPEVTETSKPKVTKAPKPKPSSSCPAVDSKFPHFYRHNTDCSIFYMCNNGFAHEFTCPANLHFNLKLNVCDWPQNSDCGKDA